MRADGQHGESVAPELILISATEDGQPRVDVMDVVKAKNFTGCLRARLGTLTVSVTTGSLQTTSLTVMACTATTPTCVVRSFW